MTIVDNFLEKIDNVLKDRKDSEILMIQVGIFFIVASVVYFYLFPVTQRLLKQSQNSLNIIKAKVKQEKGYIESNTVNGNRMFYINKKKRDIESLKKSLKDTMYVNGYVDDKLKRLSYLLYNDVNWAKFIDKISENAKKYKVNINVIKNSFNNLNYKKVEQALNIEVDANGKFNSVMKFINSVEESKLVVDVYDLKMDKNDTIHTNFKIAVWGIKY